MTGERWPVGEVISIELQKEWPPVISSELQIGIQVRVASHGEDGVGLGFMLPNGLDPGLWEQLVRNADIQTETDHIASIFRLVRAILFVCRLCSSGADEAIQMLGGELDESRTKSAVEVALKAEKLLSKEPNSHRKHAHPNIVTTILKDASWSNDELMQQLWAGILSSSATVGGTDQSIHSFVELLAQLTAAQGRILVAGCRKTRDLLSRGEAELAREIVITPEEMIQITGTYDLYRNATEVAYLFNSRLLEKVFDFTSYVPKDSFNITPSFLALELLRLCRCV